MSPIPRLLACAVAASAVTACHTTPAPDSGFLSNYSDLENKGKRGVALRQRRDDIASDRVASVYLEPSVMAPGVGNGLTENEREMVMREVDRQICIEVSERFTIAPAPTSDSATIRTSVVRLHPTGRVGALASLGAGLFVPIINLRPPTQTGGLAIESEMLEAGTSQQIAAISWAQNAQYVGRDGPSFSRVGDALQMAEGMGDAVGDAFSSKAREVTPIPKPDPCAARGSRRNLARQGVGFAFGMVSGVYSPEVSGIGAPRQQQP